MNVFQRQSVIDISGLNDHELESTLALSDFLTRYHAQFSTLPLDKIDVNDHGDDQERQNSDSDQDEPSKDKRVVISPQDLLSAIDYRHDMERYNILATLIRTVKQPDFYGKNHDDPMNDNEIGRNNQNLDKLLQQENTRLSLRMQSRVEEGRMSTDQDVLEIIEALEVKVTKEISTELLLDTIMTKDTTHHHDGSSGGGKSSAGIPSCSVLLGIPSGNYLATVLPKCLYDLEKSGCDKSNDQIFATLAVPANALTWKELLRLSEMVSKVEDADRDAIYSSHLTYTNMVRQDLSHRVNGAKINLYTKERLSGDDKMLLSTHSVLRGTDLVALWVRAQRDTGASRHLLALFNIDEVKDEKSANESERLRREEVIDVDAADKGIPKEISFVPDPQPAFEFLCSPQYSATFVGNPSKLRNRIEKEAQMLDKLTEWAVMNQILFTQEHMRKLVAENDTKSGSNHKKRGAESVLSANDCQKRSRICQDMSENLQIAYQSYILRWFVRRNYNIMRIVLSSTPLDDATYMASLGVKVDDIMRKIKTYLGDKFNSTDRTIARIDRRILIGKFSNFEMFKKAVKQLLEALGSVLSHNENVLDQVECANEDFDNLCNAILSNEQHDYMPLVKPKSSIGRHDRYGAEADDIALILISHPKPWSDEKCSLCSQQMFEETRLTCSNCGQCAHTLCSSSYSSPSKSLDDNAFKYLTGIYLSMKDLPQEPDFVQHPISWEKKVVRLQRKATEHGKLPKWGIKMHNTESCSEELDEGLHNFVNPTRWKNINDTKLPVEGVPMRVPYSGLIVIKSQGPAMFCGLKEGDVIVEVEVSNQKSSAVESKVLKELQNGDDRKQLMGTPSEKIVFTIYRPSVTIVTIAKQFNEALLNAHSEAKKMHNDIMQGFWYCDNCKEGTQCSPSVKDEALLCQMVIRRIGMEECFRPFHDEDAPLTITNEDLPTSDEHDKEVISVTSKNSSESCAFNMDHFDHISLRRLDQIMTYLSSPIEDQPCSQCFYTPPWTEKEKLCWSRPSLIANPSRLLCAGILLMIRRAKNIGFNETKIRPLVQKFMRTFVPWCLDYRSHKSKGPPLDAKVAIAPWLLESCKGCALRSVFNSNSTFCSFCAGRNTESCHDQKGEGRNKEIEVEATSVDATLYSEQLSHNKILRYDLHSSYVGTSLLISIDDPLVRGVYKKTKLIVDEGRRNVELLVMCYVPKSLITKDNKGKLVYEDYRGTFNDHWQTAEGLFYILPIFSHFQMNYISQFCDKRQPGTLPSNSAMLSLEGIIALTPSEFMTRLQASVSMQAAVDRAVGSIAAKFGKSKLPTIVMDDREGSKNAFSQLLISDYDFMDITHVLCSDDLPLVPNLRCLQSDRLLWALQFCLKVPTHFFLTSRLNTMHRHHNIGIVGDDYLQTFGKKLTKLKGAAERTKLKGVEESRNAAQNLIKCLSNMIAFDESDAEKKKECDVCYSDLMYWRPSSSTKSVQTLFNAMNACNKIVSMIQLGRPQPIRNDTPGTETVTAVLHRDFGEEKGNKIMMDSDDDEFSPEESVNANLASSSSKFRGEGWGMELIRWSGEEQFLRVGRIAPASPAEASGLKMHDIVTAINGLGVVKLKSTSELARNLLGEIDLDKKLRSDKFPAVPYLFNRRNKDSVKGPIVLSIFRLIKHLSRQSHLSQSSQHLLPKVNHGPPKPLQAQYPQHSSLAMHMSPQMPLRPPQIVTHRYRPPLTTHQHRPLPPSVHPSPSQLSPTDPQLGRVSLMTTDLYNAGVNGSFFSIAEIAVMMHSISENHPRLSTRLLKPRYSAHRINDEYVQVIKPYAQKHGLEKIPFLSNSMWQSILRYDLKRMQNETGPVVFYENNFGYKEPNQIFPIDRFFEKYFAEEQKQNATINLTLELAHQYSTVHTQTHPGPDVDIMRIRGGGVDEEDGYANSYGLFYNSMQSFDSIALENSEKRWIIGETSKNKVFIGRIERLIGYKYTLNYIYTSDKGVFARPTSGEIDPKSKVSLVPNVVNGDSINEIVQKGLLQLQNLTKEMTSKLVLNQRDELFFTLLGVLPDGRSLHWFSSDPKGVYLCAGKLISAPPIDSPEILFSFQRNAMDSKCLGFPPVDFTAANTSHFCPWGCCAQAEDPDNETKTLSILSFESVEEWQDHIHTFHLYSSSRSNIHFTRIGEGTSIQDLCADLTSHICSISVAFHKFASPYERKDDANIGVQNHPMLKSIIFDVPSFPRLPNKRINLSMLKGDENLRLLGRSLRVWDRLVYLYNVEVDGKLRSKFVPQSCTKFQPEKAEKENLEFKNFLDGVEAEMLESSSQIETPKSVTYSSCIRNIMTEGKNLNCQLCNGSNESNITSKKNDGSQHSLGCGLTSSLCFAGDVNSATRAKLILAINGMLPTKGDLDVLKILVLKIAANIPQSLHASKMPMFADIPLSSFWDHIDIWIRFTSKCLNIRMLAQSVVTLQASIKKQKLPRWWKSSNTGWSASFSMMQSPTISSISVLLYVLDIAVSEYMATTKDDLTNQVEFTPTYPIDSADLEEEEEEAETFSAFLKKIDKMPVKDRYILLETLATKFGLPPHDDEYAEECMECGIGGDLLCCEYCHNVTHSHCVRFTSDLDEVAFVCKECIIDIAKLKDAWDREDVK